MPVRIACLIVLAVLAASVTATTTTTGKGASTTVSYKVEYRRPGPGPWSLKGTFNSSQSAAAEADRLYKAGHDVRVTKAEVTTRLRTPQRPGPSPEPGGTHNGISIVSLERAYQLFRQLAVRKDIAFRYPSDGCYARAHLMGRQLQEVGLKPGKGWAFDDRAMTDRKAAPRLFATTRNHPRGFVFWKYHVAPLLYVREPGGSPVAYILDPSLFERPTRLSAWQRRMVHPRIGFAARLDVTPWGVPPKDGTGRRMPGTGYWPSSDPGPLDTAARRTMAMYKPHEGTDWLPGRTAITRRDGEMDPRALPEKTWTEKDHPDLKK